MPETKTTTDPAGPPSVALDLLNDLESRLDALKSWQTQSEQHAEKMREQSRLLEEQRHELEAHQQRLDAVAADNAQQAAALDQRRAALEAEAAQLTTQRDQLEAERAALAEQLEAFAAEQAQIEQQLDDRRAAVEQARRQQEQDATRQLAELDEQRQQADDREARLDEAYAKLREDESELLLKQDQLRGKLARAEKQQQEAEHRLAELDTKSRELEARAAQLDQRSAELDRQRAELEALRAELDGELESIDQREQALREQTAELETERAEVRKTREQLHRVQLDQQLRGEALVAQEQSLARARDELVERAAEAARLGSDDEGLNRALAEARAKLNAERTRADRAAAELAELAGKVEERQREADGLRRQLAERDAELSKLAAEAAKPGKPGKAAASDDTLVMEPDLADDGPDAGDTLDLPAVSGRALPIDEESVSVAALRDELETRQLELDDLAEQLAARSRELTAAQQRIAELEQQLAAAERPADDDNHADEAGRKLQAALAERDREVEDLRGDLDARVAEVELLRQRVEQLNTQLAAGEAGDDAAFTDSSESALGLNLGDLTRRSAELDEQAAQIAADRARILERKEQLKLADELIQKRRAKLRAYLAAVKQQGHRVGKAIPLGGDDQKQLAALAGQAAGLEKERQQLAEVRRFLEASEETMARRWATYETAWVVGVLISALMLMTLVSYGVGRQLAVPQFQATAALQVQPTADQADLPPGAWMNAYEQTLRSTEVLSEVVQQLQQRGLRLAATPDALATHLRDTLVVTGEPTRVTLSYRGDDAQRCAEVLDALAAGVLRYHLIQDNRQGTTDTARVLSPATADPQPLRDDRLRYSGAVLGGLVALALLIALPLRLIKGRKPRVMQDPDAPDLRTLDKPGTWSPLLNDEQFATQTDDQRDDGMGDPNDTISNYR